MEWQWSVLSNGPTWIQQQWYPRNSSRVASKPPTTQRKLKKFYSHNAKTSTIVGNGLLKFLAYCLSLSALYCEVAWPRRVCHVWKNPVMLWWHHSGISAEQKLSNGFYSHISKKRKRKHNQWTSNPEYSELSVNGLCLARFDGSFFCVAKTVWQITASTSIMPNTIRNRMVLCRCQLQQNIDHLTEVFFAVCIHFQTKQKCLSMELTQLVGEYSQTKTPKNHYPLLVLKVSYSRCRAFLVYEIIGFPGARPLITFTPIHNKQNCLTKHTFPRR